MCFPMVITHLHFWFEQNKIHLLFSDEMFDLLVRETNVFINRKLEILGVHKKHLFQISKYPYLRETSHSEMRALISFMYKIPVIFSKKFGPPIFGAIFSKERVKFLSVCLSFIDRDRCMENFPSDWFASCRPILELFNANCSNYSVPLPYLTIDETLSSMGQQISFPQFNPNKSNNCGL